MPPLGIFGGGSTSPNPPIQQTNNSTLTASMHSNSSSNNAATPPRRGIFRGLGSSWHATNSTPNNATISASQHEKNTTLPRHGASAVIDEKASMEMEYLNVINDLSKEKEEARDEIMKRVSETEGLSTSNRDLQSKVSDLETKLEQLTRQAKEKERQASEDLKNRPPTTPTLGQTHRPQRGSKQAQVFTFNSIEENASSSEKSRTEDLEQIKAKLREHQNSNQEISSRVQTLRDKYAQRRAEAEEMSDTSSVVSVGSMRSCTSMVTSPLSSPRHHLVEVKKLERNFEKEMQLNDKLTKTINKLLDSKQKVEKNFQELTKSSEEKLEENEKEIEGLKSQLAEETERFQKSEKAMAELKLGREKEDSTKDDERADLTNRLSDQSIMIAELQNEINVKEGNILSMKKQLKGEYEDKMKEVEVKLATKNIEADLLQSQLETAKKDLEEALKEKVAKVALPETEATNEDVEVSVDNDNVEAQSSKVQELEAELIKLKGAIGQVEKLKIDIVAAREELEKKDKELVALTKENETNKNNLSSLESDFITVQEKNASTFQELEDFKEKFDAEVRKSKQLQDGKESSTKAEASETESIAKLELAQNQIKELQNEVKTKEEEIKTLQTVAGKETKLQQELEGLHLVMASLKLELNNKKEELEAISDMKNQSFNKLETIEKDMSMMALKSSATFDELEDLKEKFDRETQEKRSLKEALEKFSPEQILEEAKKETDAELKQKDNEIHKLRKGLIDANVAKTDIELKLMDIMNDVVKSQSTRDIMRTELDKRLDEENDRASQLEHLIKDKEDDMERMRKEFDDLRIEMEKETETKRSEISNLNGEVVEKASLLSSRDREFLQLAANMDELKLQHKTEVASLRREINEFGANEKEVQRVHHRNIQLEGEVAILRNEIRRLQLNDRVESDNMMLPQSSARVLRTRNGELVGEVEKLQRRLRRMKRNVTRIEL